MLVPCHRRKEKKDKTTSGGSIKNLAKAFLGNRTGISKVKAEVIVKRRTLMNRGGWGKLRK